MTAPITTPDEPDELHRRIARRVLPLLVAGYVLNTLNKTNIGFASLAMNRDIGLTTEAFGLGAGLFFLTYTLFEIPSNLMMRKVGARIWLSRILISWGLVSMAMALAWNESSFYVLRLLLGIAEAGWYPGVIYYLSLWFPRQYKARATTFFFLGAPIAAIFGSPISGALLSLPTVAGLHNWQWLFILEGLPTVLLGVIALRGLCDTPAQAEWLSRGDRAALALSLDTERQSVADPATREAETGSYARRLTLFCAMNFANALGLYSTFIWIPRVVKQLGSLSNLETGFVTAVPYAAGAVMLILCARNSDRTGDRKWHVAALLTTAGIAMAAIVASPSPQVSLVLLTVSVAASIGVQGVLFAMFTEALQGAKHAPVALASGLATITTVGNLGGFAGPTAIGKLLGASGSLVGPLLLIAASFAITGLLVALSYRSALGGSMRLARV